MRNATAVSARPARAESVRRTPAGNRGSSRQTQLTAMAARASALTAAVPNAGVDSPPKPPVTACDTAADRSPASARARADSSSQDAGERAARWAQIRPRHGQREHPNDGMR